MRLRYEKKQNFFKKKMAKKKKTCRCLRQVFGIKPRQAGSHKIFSLACCVSSLLAYSIVAELAILEDALHLDCAAIELLEYGGPSLQHGGRGNQ